MSFNRNLPFHEFFPHLFFFVLFGRWNRGHFAFSKALRTLQKPTQNALSIHSIDTKCDVISSKQRSKCIHTVCVFDESKTNHAQNLESATEEQKSIGRSYDAKWKEKNWTEIESSIASHATHCIFSKWIKHWQFGWTNVWYAIFESKFRLALEVERHFRFCLCVRFIYMTLQLKSRSNFRDLMRVLSWMLWTFFGSSMCSSRPMVIHHLGLLFELLLLLKGDCTWF